MRPFAIRPQCSRASSHNALRYLARRSVGVCVILQFLEIVFLGSLPKRLGANAQQLLSVDRPVRGLPRLKISQKKSEQG